MAWNSLVRERHWHRLSCLGLALLLTLGGVRAGQAAEPAKDAKQEAKARFTAGQSHYNLNEFSEALREFKEAYRLLPDPVFLYNLGQCERQLGHAEEAIRFYRSFLREQPKAPNRQEVLNKISELEESLKNKPAEPDKAIAPPPPLEPAKPVPATVPPPAVAPPPSPPPGASVTIAPAPSLPATPPVSPESAGATSERADLTAAAEPPPETGPVPIYKRWWFWTAAAAVAVGAGLGIYLATAGGGSSAPASDLGSHKVF
jgi:tetratricopeptide (TPR) repeat protein